MTLRLIAILASGVVLSACSGPLDLDLRSLGRGPDTSDAVANAKPRPQADARGVISYPTYQVAVARRGDTVTKVANRLGVPAAELARHNGIKADTPLRDGELLALPRRVESAGPVQSEPLPAAQSGDGGTGGPVRHQVGSGETAFSIARLYNVPVQVLAQWNGLGSDLAVREGQFLMIPASGQAAPVQVSSTTLPEQGQRAPVPPSSTKPLPAKVPAPVAPAATASSAAGAAAGTAGTAAGTARSGASRAGSAPATAPKPAPQVADTAKMVRPVPGTIVRAYAKGRNDGVDFAAPAGTPVKAADKGTVAAITEDTSGAKIVVLRHSGGLLTVYVNVSDLSVKKGASVRRGQTIAKIAPGEAQALHFEVRRGLDSLDPAGFLP